MGNFPVDELPEEYAALRDPIQVMAEVLRLVGDLHRVTSRLGDAIVAAGFPARAWRTDDAWLAHLPGELPEITLDTLLTRLAEFAADLGQHWLREGEDGIARFHEETLVLYEVMRPLRSFAQRQRVLPARERGEQPLWRVLGDSRLATPLDRVTGLLRDLDALIPFLSPLGPQEWKQVEALVAAEGEHGGADRLEGGAPIPQEQAPGEPQPWLVDSPASASVAMGEGGAAPLSTMPEAGAAAGGGAGTTANAKAAPRRLRDYVPTLPLPGPEAGTGRRGHGGPAGWARGAWNVMQEHRWVLVAGVAVLLAMGTGLLTLAARGQEGPLPPPKLSYLQAKPDQLKLTCRGKGSAATLVVQDIGKAPETWTTTVPAGLALSVTKGTLKPGASVTIRVTVTTPKATRGTLIFNDEDGTLSVPYTVTCS